MKTNDANHVALVGRLASQPEVAHEDGRAVMRLLVALRTDEPFRRIDVIPVRVPDPANNVVGDLVADGARILVTGSLQRRFTDGATGRRSRLEVVANEVDGPRLR